MDDPDTLTHKMNEAEEAQSESSISNTTAPLPNADSQHHFSFASPHPYQPPNIASDRPTYSSVLTSGSTSKLIYFDSPFHE